MDRFGKWKRQLLLCILGLIGLAMIAGSSAAAPVDPEHEGRQVSIEQHEEPVLTPLSRTGTSEEASVAPEPEGQLLVSKQHEISESPPLTSAGMSEEAPIDPEHEGRQIVSEQNVAAELPPSASAGTSDYALVDGEPRGQMLFAGQSEASDLEPSSSVVTPAELSTSLQQAKVSTPDGEGEQELKASVNQQSEPTTKGSGGDTEQTKYTWEDGDRTLTVILQSDLAIDEGASAKGAMADAPGGAIVKSEGSRSEGNEKSLPVFKSQSGALMTLPGGILLVLDPDWSQAEVNAFFSSNSIKLSKVEALGYIDNGYFIETEPGFPSLDLANSVAAQEGVMVSSPNWWTEVTVK